MISIALAAVLTGTVSASSNTYWYNRDMQAIEIPDVYVNRHILSLENADDTPAVGVTDMFIAPSGDMYILNGRNGEVLLYDRDYRRQRVLSVFHSARGKPFTLKNPQGIFVSKDGWLYIADTDNHRVIRCDATGREAEVFGRPNGVEELKNDEDYQPLKIVVDSSGRMFITAKSVVNGILSLTRDGEFITYLGAPPVSLNPLTAFWRKFATEEQKKRMINYIPTEYSNLTIDDSGFLYGTISAITKEDFEAVLLSGGIETTAIRKINTVGQDILRRQGKLPIVGDLVKGAQSSIVDVALSDYGIYCLLDAANGHVLAYDADGNMLFVFGELSDRKGAFLQPVAMDAHEGRLYVLDTRLAQVLVFERTAYGNTLYAAIREEDEGNFDRAFAAWEKVLEQNPTFDLAYSGTGNLYLQKEDYKQAMSYFKIANDMEGYSDAFELSRKQYLKEIAPWIFGAAGLMILALLLWGPARRMILYIRT